MKIVVDINHPAHVHYFKNFIWEITERGHQILVTASEKDVSYKLLDAYRIPYIKIGNYGKSIYQKFINIPILDYKMYLAVKNFNPDLFLGFGSIRAAHISTILRKPCINLDDSEPSPQEHLLYVPFSNVVITPTSFRKNFGRKHIRCNSYIELAYLHPNWFRPDSNILELMNIGKSERYTLIRFVSWGASHDIGHHGIIDKINLVKEMEEYGPVFISSEKELGGYLEKFRLSIQPENLHSLLNYANLFICDGQTMTTEAAILGIPTIRCNSFVGKTDMGNFIELEQKYGLIYNYRNMDDALVKIKELSSAKNLKKTWLKKRDKLLKDKIDMTAFLVDFVENYPHVPKCIKS